MKFSTNWLSEFIQHDLSIETLVDHLTNAGLEVDSVTALDAEIKNIIVANVVSAEPHPDADRLKLCQVDTGSGDTVQVVCGGSNVRTGLNVILAQVGARLPGGLKIKKSKIRGQESYGMICSAQELRLEENSAGGILELPEDAPIGQDGIEYLQLNDVVIDVDLTPNRGDCLSLLGIARELATIELKNVKSISEPQVTETITIQREVKTLSPESCPRYAGRVVKGVNAKAQTPYWMKERLRRSGVRPVSAIVDVANYVMLELGQPTHTFDLDKVEGHLRVRYANEGESIELLDGHKINCDASTLLIADEKKALALAGVMGGANSSVSDSTTNLLLESAYFGQTSVAGKARQYNLTSEGCFRHERGIDPTLQVFALNRLTELLQQIVGGQAGPIVEVVNSEYLPQQSQITLRKSRIKRLLGFDLKEDWVEACLQRVCETVKQEGDTGWVVTPPAYRFDICIEADLIEELARLYGYAQIEATTPKQLLQPKTPGSDNTVDEMRKFLSNRGFAEAITYSFTSKQLANAFNPDNIGLELLNPISEELSTMRGHLAPGLLTAVKHNLNRQQHSIALFEVGMCFNKTNQLPDLKQKTHCCVIATGDQTPILWNAKTKPIDFFYMKNEALQLLASLGFSQQVMLQQSQLAYLHPGQQAQIFMQDQCIGEIGALHPQLLSELDVDCPVFIFSVKIEDLQTRPRSKFAILSKYPAIKRDLAFVVEEHISAKQVTDQIQQSAGSLLRDVILFDVYQGAGIADNKKSVAMSLVLQDNERTLTDDEVNEIIETVVEDLGNNLRATLRTAVES